MDNYEFNLLPINDKTQYTWDAGTYLASRSDYDHNINLYHVDKFFVEVWYNPEVICIDKIRSFKNRKCLEPYLDKINLPFSNET